MSVAGTRWALEMPDLSASQKLVLLALGGCQGPDHKTCNPSITTLTRYTGLNRKTVITALQHLQKSGLIDYDPASRMRRNYALNVEKSAPDITARKPRNPARNLERPEGANVPTNGTLNGEANVPKYDSVTSQNNTLNVPTVGTKRVEGEKNKGFSPQTPQGGLAVEKPPAETGQNFTQIADRVIGYLNDRTGKRYRTTTANRERVTARLREGFTEHDCCAVIDNRVSRWQGTSQAQYLRPDTLFRPSKFEGYLNDHGETGMPDENQSLTGHHGLAESRANIERWVAEDEQDPFALPAHLKH